MRIRNGNRILSHEAVIESQELGEIEVLSFSVIDEENLKELSQQMHNDLHIFGLQANHDKQTQISEENSRTNQNIFAQAIQSQTMENEEGDGEEDSGKVKSNLLTNNGVETTSSNTTMNLKLITSSSTDEGSGVYKNEETSSQKRIRLICERLKQSETAAAAAATDVGYEYDLRPRRLGRVIKMQSLESINDKKNQKSSSSNANKEEDILIIDMLSDEMKKKLRGNLEKKTAEKKP